MITKIIDENSISVIPEDSDDLFNLRRIVKEGDTVVGDTTRVIKQEKDYSRPDKGERVKVRIALMVEKISLDDGASFQTTRHIQECSGRSLLRSLRSA